MKSFDINTLDVSKDMKSVLPDLVNKIIHFLENAKNKTVVIEYD